MKAMLLALTTIACASAGSAPAPARNTGPATITETETGNFARKRCRHLPDSASLARTVDCGDHSRSQRCNDSGETMAIHVTTDIADGKHSYGFEYTLPEGN